jgi:molecular chaperone DnaK
LNVSAKDKNTGKENKITIKANSGLTDAEIQDMIKDAELNAEDDRKAIALINARNSAESQLNMVRPDLDKYRDQLAQADCTALDVAIAALETAVAETDTDDITAKIGEMMTASNPLYKIKAEAEKPAETTAESAGKPAKQDDPNVVDAVFTEKTTKE